MPIIKTNWMGRAISGSAYAAAANVPEVVARLKEAIAHNAPVRVLAGRHSDPAVLSTRGMQLSIAGVWFAGAWARPYAPTFLRPELAKRAKYFVEVSAGARVDDVNRALASKGLALPMLGAYSGQTLIGAIQTSTHGTGIKNGPLASRVRSIEVVVAGSKGVETLRVEPPDPRRVSDPKAVALRGQDPSEQDWFDALCVSVGSMGVVTSVVVEAVDAFRLRSHRVGMTWNEAKALLASEKSPVENSALHGCALLINPYSGSAHGDQECILEELSIIGGPNPDLPLGWGGAPSCTDDIGQGVEIAIPTKHQIADQLRAFAVKYVPGPLGDQWNDSYKLLCGPNKYPGGVSIEYAFPLSDYLTPTDTLLEKARELHDADKSCVGPVSLRFVGPCDALLSLTHGGARATVEVLAATGSKTTAMHHGEDALRALTSVALDPRFKGRAHWGQMLPTKLSTATGRYPEYKRWLAVRDALDPGKVFRNQDW